ncbi:MAG: amidohydrolase family protein [Candidatus Latescibacterota bacterium]|jgi:predicted TIM-barrel fold metal-dependent hydrolase
MIVDTHVHVWEIDPPRYPIGPTAPNWTAMPDEPGTSDELLAEMDACGVDWTVLVQTSWSTWDNGYIADSVARFPRRFIGHGLVDPLAADNAATARYWMRERGLAGFRFHPLYYPDQQVLLRPENGPLWEELESLGAVVQFHMRAADAGQVAAVARAHRRLRCIVDHLGYPDLDAGIGPFQPILDLGREENLFLKLSDVAGRSRQGYPYADVHPFLQALLSVFGSSRTVWGTGYPGHHRAKHNWPSLDQELRLVREGLPFLTARDRDRILGGTAAAIWNLS